MTSDEFDGAVWHKSTYSGSNNGCVERGRLSSGRQAVRDTKDRERGAVVFDPMSWQTFVDAVNSGADGALWHTSTYSGSDNNCVERGRLSSGRQAVRDTKDRERGAVVFGPVSWQTFVDAVNSGADGALWHKSTYSGSDNGCVERGRLSSGRQAVHDTKDRERGAVVFGPTPWQTFVDAVNSGALSA